MREQIRKFITDNFLFGADSGLSDDDSLLEKGIIDSTGVLELVGFIEEGFHVAVKDDELLPEHLDSVNRLLSFITRKTAEAA